jgi:hypothetical protein
VSSGAAALWRNRHAFGAGEAQTRTPGPGIVIAEGGGFYPTLFFVGGGAVAARHRANGGRPA